MNERHSLFSMDYQISMMCHFRLIIDGIRFVILNGSSLAENWKIKQPNYVNIWTLSALERKHLGVDKFSLILVTRCIVDTLEKSRMEEDEEHTENNIGKESCLCDRSNIISLDQVNAPK